MTRQTPFTIRRLATGDIDLGDNPAIQLYTKLGTRKDVQHFDIAVT